MNLKNDRLYLIADWEDIFCDLTFSKMVDRMGKMGIKNPKKQISFDKSHLDRVVNELEDTPEEKQEKKTLLQRFKNKLHNWNTSNEPRE